MHPGYKKIGTLLGLFLALWLVLRYFLPVFFPFLLGLLLALAAEPGVRFLSRKTALPRGASAGISVTVVFLLIVVLLGTLLTLLFRQLQALSGVLPAVTETAQRGIASLRAFCGSLALRTPEPLRSALESLNASLFSGGTALLEKVGTFLLGLAGNLLRGIPDSALGLGTAVISGYMISAKLPGIAEWFRTRIPRSRLDRLTETFRQTKASVFGWLSAQMKLTGITFLILLAGMLLLRVPQAPVWAFVIALLDALPILGTGTVLVPWAVICLIQGNIPRALGLLGTYVTAAVTRSVLEPKLVGQQLGMDSLVTLLALYTGYRLWGIGGMLLAPVLTVTARQILR